MITYFEVVQDWVSRGKEMGATHLISACDRFNYEDYPVFVMPEQDLAEVRKEYENNDNMQSINEVIDLEYKEKIVTWSN